MNVAKQHISNTTTILKTMRLPFLSLAVFCVLLGLATAMLTQAAINWFDFGLCLIAAVAAQIAVNTLNEYQDFKSGLDLITVRTPFSGGSGGLVENPAAASAVKKLAIIAILLTIIIGLYFVYHYSTELFPLGLLGIIIIISYTKYLNKNPWLCLFAPGVGIGLLMVLGTSFVLTGQYTISALSVGLICLCLINNLLLLNQIPDAEADKHVGRNHFIIAFGTKRALMVYALFLLLAASVLLLAGHFHFLPKLSYIALIPMLAAAEAVRIINSNVINNNVAPEPLRKGLGLNVVAVNGTPLLLAIAIIISTIH
ncbi:hypothetical protein A9Q98_01025 [Thalassotalea sp. 42_200_T64]|nr:hypothetical protein A9Q98_01025 [Thalassotalea sp. 42_200_T64]